MGKRKSQKSTSVENTNDSKAEEAPFSVLITTYLSYLILIIFGKKDNFYLKYKKV